MKERSNVTYLSSTCISCNTYTDTKYLLAPEINSGLNLAYLKLRNK